ncbi:short chain dehydrogenase [Agromyces sp. SYSU T00266]|uniref:short chain dehydrogenase n=1 Tax=Agromyces zhanjiangensis TaxID=3158562 RepID=UPI003390B0FE
MKVLVVGANGHVGSAAVDALEARHEVIGVGRSSEPPVDVTEPGSIERLFETVGEVDAIVSAIGSVPFKPLADLSRDDYLAGFAGKVLSQLDVVRIGTPYLRDRGSITLTTGILAREPIHTGAAAAMANGAIEAFVMAAAAELPRGIRINAVSPTVLEEAEGYHDAFPGFLPVPASVVGQAFRKSIEGVQTGRVFEVD